MNDCLAGLRDLGRGWGVVGEETKTAFVDHTQNIGDDRERFVAKTANLSKSSYTNTNTNTYTKTNTNTNTEAENKNKNIKNNFFKNGGEMNPVLPFREKEKNLSPHEARRKRILEICRDITVRLKIESNKWLYGDVEELVEEFGEYLFYYGVGKALRRGIPRLKYVRGVLRNLDPKEREKGKELEWLMPTDNLGTGHVPRHLWAPPWNRELGEFGPSNATCLRMQRIFGTENITPEHYKGLLGLPGGCDITEAMETYYGKNWRNLDEIYERRT